MPPSALPQILSALPFPALAVTRGQTVEAANAAARGLLGEAIEGRHIAIALRQPALLEAVEGCLHDGAPRHIRWQAPGAGRTGLYHVTCAGIGAERPAGSGRPPPGGVLLTFQDITQIKAAGQARRDFVANVSHELRTPLTALVGFIETLRGPARDDAAARARFLAVMASEAQRMNRLVDDLLSLSRVEAEERLRPTGRVDLAVLLRSVQHNLMPLAREGRAGLADVLPEGSAVVPGDADQLRQVFANLIENAIKYGGPGCTVRVRLAGAAHDARLRGPAVRVTVEDDGPGIAPEHIPRLTERFYRADSHRSRAMGGTGLGLAIVKHILTRHRGRLEIDSAPGQGSRFTCVLPAE